MTDYLSDTPVVMRGFCPACEPGTDPEREPVSVQWCQNHSPARDGADDERVDSSSMPSGSAEAGGDENRVICDFLHRGKLRTG